MKRISFIVLVVFFILAGFNHFRDPEFYLPLIPDYFAFPQVINMLSGMAEIILGLGLIFKATRKYAAYALLGLLIAFVPSHVYFIQIGGCVTGGLCAPIWVGWVRLVVIHPLLLFWIWNHRR